MTIPLTTEDAIEFTDALQQLYGGTGDILESGYRFTADGIKRGVPQALGLSNDAWARSVIPARRYELEERRNIVAELIAEGMSRREIAATLGVSKSTVSDDVAVQNRTTNGEMPNDHAPNLTDGVQDWTDDPDEGEWWNDDESEPQSPTLSVVPDSEPTDDDLLDRLPGLAEVRDVARVRLIVSKGLKEFSTTLILAPESVAENCIPDVINDLLGFRERLDVWVDAVEAASNRGLRAVK